jgi:hypothetical protein
MHHSHPAVKLNEIRNVITEYPRRAQRTRQNKMRGDLYLEEQEILTCSKMFFSF